MLLEAGCQAWCILFETTQHQDVFEGRRLRLLLASMDDLVYVIGLDGSSPNITSNP